MSEQIELDQTLIKLNKNNYDISKLTPQELENLQKDAPVIFEAISKIGKLGLKAQEKVYSTIDKAIEIFREQLKDPNLSAEDRDKLNDRIERMVEKAIGKDTEYKKWVFALVGVGVGGVALALGGKSPELRKIALNLITKGKPM